MYSFTIPNLPILLQTDDFLNLPSDVFANKCHPIVKDYHNRLSIGLLDGQEIIEFFVIDKCKFGSNLFCVPNLLKVDFVPTTHF